MPTAPKGPSRPRLVTVHGRDYGWDPVRGLDPHAVEGVQGFLHRKAWGYRAWGLSVGLEVEDLIQEGFTGALKAAARYNPDQGSKFLTYAAWWIDAAMREALERRFIRTPEGRDLVWVGSLDAPLGAGDPEEASTFLDFQEDAGPGPLELTIEAEQRALVLNGLRGMDARTREVVLRHTGLDGRPSESLVRISEDLGVSRQRVSQILERVVDDLSGELAG